MDEAQFLEELRNDFFEEANTLVQSLEENILELEKDTHNKEALNEIFRAAHTLKGGAATLDLDRVSNFTHEMENLLDILRTGEIEVTERIVDTLLRSIDIVKTMIEKSKVNIELDEGFEDIILKELQNHAEKKILPEKKKEILETTYQKHKIQKIDFKLNEYERYLVKNAILEGSNIFEVYILLNESNPMKTVSGIQIFSILKSLGEVVKSFPDMDELMGDTFVPEVSYLFITKQDKSLLKNKVFLSDVTDLVEVFDFEDQDIVEKSAEDKDIKTVDDLQLDEEHGKLILTFISKGYVVYKLTVTFDDLNPMRSVSGLLFFTMVKSYGEIITSVPTFDDYKKDVFYVKGIFIIATTTPLEVLKSKLYISDITKELKFQEFRYKKEEFNDELLQYLANQTENPKEVVGVTTFNDKKEEKVQQLMEEIKISKPAPEVKPKEPVDNNHPESSASAKDKKATSSMLRVESKRIDDLLNLLGELVISKASFLQITDNNNSILEQLTSIFINYKKDIKGFFNELLTLSGSFKDDDEKAKIEAFLKDRQNLFSGIFDKMFPEYKNMNEKLRSTSQSLSRITDDLHEGVMKVRMVPINQIFSRFPRLIRDLKQELNKDINLIIQGEETELDKGMVEDLIDPLIHIVRNSVDHGIETPDVRIKAGKSPTGTLLLKAEHEGNIMVITIEDDGKGLSKDKILKKAVEKKLVEPGVDLGYEEVINILFQPGFSTAEKVTSLSGRGVGLDVVKRKVESINGNIYIESEEGKYTRMTIKIPLTLAIIQALLVKISDYIYSIPINSVIETQRIFPNEIELLEQNEVIRIRDEVLSLVRMDKVFRHFSHDQKEYYYVIIVGTSNKKLGLVVDSLIGEQDIVIKPLDSKYANSPGIAGATILGDGQVSLIIDVHNLFDYILTGKPRK